MGIPGSGHDGVGVRREARRLVGGRQPHGDCPLAAGFEQGQDAVPVPVVTVGTGHQDVGHAGTDRPGAADSSVDVSSRARNQHDCVAG